MMKFRTLIPGLLLVAACSNPLVSGDRQVSVQLDPAGMQILYAGQPVQRVDVPLGEGTLDRKAGVYHADGFDVEFHVCDEGVAFRFLGPEPETVFRIPEGTPRWLGRDGYESLFPRVESASTGKWGYPALVEYGPELFGLIAEGSLERGHCGSYLISSEGSDAYVVSPADEKPAYTVSPWRVVQLGSLASLVEKSLITDLTADCRLEDCSWIHPGVSSWIYWAYNHGSKDYTIVKDYIDLAAEMHWPYCLIDWEWPQMVGGTVEQAIDYAARKGVRVTLWYNSGTSWTGSGSPQPEDRMRNPEAREKEMSWLESLGVAGIKVDFFSPDSSEMINYYLDILEDAARHHLLVDFHGSTIPRGWQKTWPNLMSAEAVWGAEWYNNVPFFGQQAASHNATLPFTRGLMGPMDYTPGTFSDSQHPHFTTYAHELALPVLYQSSLQHMPDRPEVYRNLPQEVRSLLSGLPVVWDETRLLDGYPGHHVVMARRKGDCWYIAGINGTDEPLRLSWTQQLPAGSGTLFADGGEDRAFAISTITELPDGVDCRGRGGFVCLWKMD